ncbi:unnamed protein product [Adineta ricciae]|uniref:guanylate cyclase n=1 Tax=Adineta ricciae TaxID=249248 RepID=A0A813UBC5_ADIRI|nr:unnamed protein product [Adineta ricciae]CAF1036497.1 unnamed protein product [Adineta ricciae]
MLYGILLESCRDGIIVAYGHETWKRIVQELGFEHETFTILGRYNEDIIQRIAECLTSVMREGSPDYYMEFFGKCFVRFFTTYGYDKILRVAGRHFGDFLHAIDQLHDSNRFSFPQMKSPLFSVAEEDEHGVVLMYKTRRRGFQHYVVGQLRECAKNFYNQNIKVTAQEDLSTSEYTRIMFRVDFNNEVIKQTTSHLTRQLSLTNVTGLTFFKIFPFCVVIDPEMRISQLGPRLRSLFTDDSCVVGKHISDVFTLVRPDILHIEWEKFLKYGKSVVFVMQSCIPLKPEVNKLARNRTIKDQNINNGKSPSTSTGSIKLKGQMKYIPSWHKLAFLCHPMLSTVEEMVSIGLYLSDLNFYDGSSEILISGIQHARQLQAAIDKQHAWITKLQHSRNELREYREKGKCLLYSLMPRHIAKMLQQGVLANSICESHKLLTVLFGYSIDMKEIIQKMSPEQVVDCINRTVNVFDTCSEKFDVYKVETKADSSYLIVAGIQDRSAYSNRHNSNVSLNTTSSSIGDDHNTSRSRSSSTNHLQNEVGEEYVESARKINFARQNSKNPYNFNQAEIICALALELLTASRSMINPLTRQPFRMKFGFHSGPAVGGIVGHRNYQYCLFGDTVNTASRVATSGEIGKIQFSAASYELLKDSIYFETVYQGKTEMKGKGFMETYYLIGPTSIYLSLLETTRKQSINVHDSQIENQDGRVKLDSDVPIHTNLKVPDIMFDDDDLSERMSILTQTSPSVKHNVINKMTEKQSPCPFSSTAFL